MTKRAKSANNIAKTRADASESPKRRVGVDKSAFAKKKREERIRKIDEVLGCKLDDEIWIDLWHDAAFRPILGREEAKEALIGLLNAVAKQANLPPIVDVWHLNPVQLREKIKGKETYVDLLVEDETGRRYVIEMQAYRDDDFLERFTYYGSRAYTNQMDEGKGFSDIKTVCCIAFVRGPLFLDDKNLWFAESTHHFKGREGKEELGPVKEILVRIPKKGEIPKGPLAPELVNWQRVIGGYSRMSKEERDELEAVTPGLKNLREVMKTFTSARRRVIRQTAIERAAYEIDRQKQFLKAKEEIREAREKVREARKKEREAREKEREAREKEREAREKEREAREKEREAREKEREAREKERAIQIAYLRDVLDYRFGVDPEESEPLLVDKSPKELEKLVEVLKKSSSYEEFRARL